MSSDYSSISQLFSHPLVLLLIGVAISGVLIPYFTNRAAKYQKGLEIKTDLMRRINEGVIRLVILLKFFGNELILAKGYHSDIRLTDNPALLDQQKRLQEELEETRSKKLDQKKKELSKKLEGLAISIKKVENAYVDADNEFRQWQVSSAVISSQIKSYFPEFEKKKKGKLTWSVFEDSVRSACENASLAYNNTLAYGPPSVLNESEIDNLLKEKDDIIAEIQNSTVSGLSEHLFSRIIKKFTPRREPIKPDVKINHESNP